MASGLGSALSSKLPSISTGILYGCSCIPMGIPTASGLGSGSLAVSFLKSYQVFLWVFLWLVA